MKCYNMNIIGNPEREERIRRNNGWKNFKARDKHQTTDPRLGEQNRTG